jgi:hypothetical protein
MATFKVQDAFGGGAIQFGPNYPGIEIALDQPPSGGPSRGYVLSAPLASDLEIDAAVDKLMSELQNLRAAAKQALQDYRKRAGIP